MPFPLVPLMIGLAAGGFATSAVGQVKAGNAARRAAEGQAERDEWNAAIAEQQAEEALAQGEQEANLFRTQLRGLIGTQRATYAGQGVDLGYADHSGRDVQADAAYLGELDVQRIHANAARQAWGFRMEAEDLRYGAEIARRTGVAQQTASRYAAAGTALGGASSLLLIKYGWDRTRTAPPSSNAG
jgi:hypothetical protein